MVFLVVKRTAGSAETGGEAPSSPASPFLYEAKLAFPVGEVLDDVTRLYNGRLKVFRICSGVEDLAEHGAYLPGQMQGLSEEQLEELNLKVPNGDDGGDGSAPSGGYCDQGQNQDPCRRRSGFRAKPDMRRVLERTATEAKAKVATRADVKLTWESISEALDILRGAVSIVYPGRLPENDPVRMELENREDDDSVKSGGGGGGSVVLDPAEAVLWFSTKEMQRAKKLSDYLSGANEKSKVVVKLTTKAAGQPAREPVLSEQDEKKLLWANHKRRQELEDLAKSSKDDNSYLNSSWADPKAMKNKMLGLDRVSWK